MLLTPAEKRETRHTLLHAPMARGSRGEAGAGTVGTSRPENDWTIIEQAYGPMVRCAMHSATAHARLHQTGSFDVLYS